MQIFDWFRQRTHRFIWRLVQSLTLYYILKPDNSACATAAAASPPETTINNTDSDERIPYLLNIRVLE